MPKFVTLKILNDFNKLEKNKNIRITHDAFFGALDNYIHKYNGCPAYVEFMPDSYRLYHERKTFIDGLIVDMSEAIGTFESYDRSHNTMLIKLHEYLFSTHDYIMNDIIANTSSYGVYVSLISHKNENSNELFIIDKPDQLIVGKILLLPKYILA